MAKPPEKCIFCGFEGELTGEHIISKRYHRDIIPRTMKSYKMLRAVEMPDRSNFTFGERWPIRVIGRFAVSASKRATTAGCAPSKTKPSLF